MGLAGGLATNGQAGSGGGGSSIPAVAFGTAAARPAAAAGNANTAYYATDTGELTVSNGTAWSALQSTSAGTFSAPQFELSGQGAGATVLAPHDHGNYWSVSNSQSGAQAFGSNGSQFQATGADIDAATVGKGFRTAEGTNAKQGTVALVAGSAVVANTSVTATSRIFLTSQADGGTPGWLRVSARTAGTSFTITSSSATDTSTVAYEIFEVG